MLKYLLLSSRRVFSVFQTGKLSLWDQGNQEACLFDAIGGAYDLFSFDYRTWIFKSYLLLS